MWKHVVIFINPLPSVRDYGARSFVGGTEGEGVLTC